MMEESKETHSKNTSKPKICITIIEENEPLILPECTMMQLPPKTNLGKKYNRKKIHKEVPLESKPKRVYTKNQVEQKQFWLPEEQFRYKQFVFSNLQYLTDPQTRRSEKIFISMSRVIGTRSRDQCRSHHQNCFEKVLRQNLFNRNKDDDKLSRTTCKITNSSTLKPPEEDFLFDIDKYFESLKNEDPNDPFGIQNSKKYQDFEEIFQEDEYENIEEYLNLKSPDSRMQENDSDPEIINENKVGFNLDPNKKGVGGSDNERLIAYPEFLKHYH